MLIFSTSAYVTCVYNLFRRLGMVSLIDIATGDVINIDFMHPLISIIVVIHVMFL